MRFWWFIGVVMLLMSMKSDVIEEGKASYYANAFEGRRTSSGEIFRQKLLTAAHKKLPFGTLVEVRNLSNDSVVVVKINDRLSQRSSHVIDLTTAAAKQLNFIRAGIAKVQLRIVTAESPVQQEPKIED